MVGEDKERQVYSWLEARIVEMGTELGAARDGQRELVREIASMREMVSRELEGLKAVESEVMREREYLVRIGNQVGQISREVGEVRDGQRGLVTTGEAHRMSVEGLWGFSLPAFVLSAGMALVGIGLTEIAKVNATAGDVHSGERMAGLGLILVLVSGVLLAAVLLVRGLAGWNRRVRRAWERFLDL